VTIGNSIHFAGSDFHLSQDDVSQELREALRDCGRGGQDASQAVAFVRSRWAITGDEANCRDMLKGYGAWEDEELADHDENLNRLVWLTGCGFCEEGEVYFSAY